MLLLGALGIARWKLEEHRALSSLRRRELLDAVERMEARRSAKGDPEGTPLLAGFPERSRCENEWPPECEAAERYFLPVNQEEGRKMAASWRGNEFPVSEGGRVLSWYAGIDPDLLTSSELLLIATVTSPFLGNPVEGESTPRTVIAGMESLRAALQRKCGACAPAPDVLKTYSHAPFPASIAVAAEVGRRGTGFANDPAPPLGQLAVSLRKGEAPPQNALERPGEAGLVALEWGRKGEKEHTKELLWMAVHGPSATDRIAALSALLRMYPEEEQWKGWEGLPGAEQAKGRAMLLLSGKP